LFLTFGKKRRKLFSPRNKLLLFNAAAVMQMLRYGKSLKRRRITLLLQREKQRESLSEIKTYF